MTLSFLALSVPKALYASFALGSVIFDCRTISPNSKIWKSLMGRSSGSHHFGLAAIRTYRPHGAVFSFMRLRRARIGTAPNAWCMRFWLAIYVRRLIAAEAKPRQ